jgi:uncharacterized protein YcfL
MNLGMFGNLYGFGAARLTRAYRIRLWFVAVLLTALAVAGCRSNPQAGTSARPALNDQGVQLATGLLIDDLTYAASGIGESSLSHEQALRVAKIDLAVDARTFEADYDANELAGDAKYKNKRFLLSGTIRSIEKDFTDRGYLVLASDNLLGVQAHLSERGMAGAASLKKGLKIFLVCQSSDRVVGTEIAGDCQRLSQYLGETKPDWESTARDFLAGKRPLPHKLGTGLATFYLVGAQLPAGSACHGQLDDGCREELQTMAKNKARMAQIEQEEQKMEANLKFE